MRRTQLRQPRLWQVVACLSVSGCSTTIRERSCSSRARRLRRMLQTVTLHACSRGWRHTAFRGCVLIVPCCGGGVTVPCTVLARLSVDLISTCSTRVETLHGNMAWSSSAAPQRCVPTEAQRLARLANAEFTPRQADAFVDQYGAWDPDAGLADDGTLDASWGEEAWDDPGA